MKRLLFLILGVLCLGSPARSIAQPRDQIRAGDATIEIRYDAPAPSEALRQMILRRVALSAKAVTSYYQRYPVHAAYIQVGFHRGRGINSGHAFGWPAARMAVSVGRDSTATDFAADWVTTHEMVHLAFPSVAEEHHWIEEGLATYVEPVARARTGELSPQKVWGDMVEGMPNGLPQAGDRGLDFTHTWGRTYWGGALFCLLADVEIRKRTRNQKGLEHALRGILNGGGSIESEWTLSRALETADRAAGVSVLEELYAKMRADPVAPDLDRLWRDLGVESRAGTVVFNDAAPLAAIRRAITQPADQTP
ncbi:MAG: hypothetical protein JO069_20620 [Verrucomicrobia bacterium]|nr:hypothetical protein [Verrucomicrobiota bacterium]